MRRFPQPDPDEIDIAPVYCFGCGRKVGVAATQKMVVYCEELCWHKEQLISFEAATRNRAFRYLVDHLGRSVIEVAAAFDRTQSRVNQILAQSNGSYLATGRKPATTDDERASRARAGKIGGSNRWSSTPK